MQSPVRAGFARAAMVIVVSRFSIALALYGLLGLLAWLTLPDEKIRGITFVLLAMFALKSWLHHRRQVLEKFEKHDVSRADS